MTPIHILGIAGSLRRDSLNRRVLAAARNLLPEGATLAPFDLDGIPLYNQDLEAPLPGPVAEFKECIRAADAVLFVTPEYNYSVPGVLKNALDWASRPSGENAWDGKPAALMGASPGNLGTARAQYHLRQILVALNMPVLNRPEVMIANAAQRFDEGGELNDAPTRERIRKLVAALVSFARQLRTPGA